MSQGEYDEGRDRQNNVTEQEYSLPSFAHKEMGHHFQKWQNVNAQLL